MPLLTGLTADGTEVPVQVEPDGVLVAEGIQGPPGVQGPRGDTGPQGPEGPPGTPGGSEIKAWANVAVDGTIVAGNNIANVERNTTGNYDVFFSVPMLTSTYAVVASGDAPVVRNNTVTQTTTQCRVLVRDATNTPKNEPFSFIILE